jgi:hypothetical protein
MVMSRRLSSGAEVGDSGEDADIDTPLFRSTPTQLWDRVDWNLTISENPIIKTPGISSQHTLVTDQLVVSYIY